MSTAFLRAFEASECRTQQEFAAFLGINQASVADAKKRGAAPAHWLVKLLCAKGVNPDWVLTGQGSRLLFVAWPHLGGTAVSAESGCKKAIDNGREGTDTIQAERVAAAHPERGEGGGGICSTVQRECLGEYSAQELVTELVRRALL